MIVQYNYVVVMPKKGYKVVTIKQELFDLLAEIAEKKGKSIPETISMLVGESVGEEIASGVD